MIDDGAAIFIHIIKTGGTSIQTALAIHFGPRLQHLSLVPGFAEFVAERFPREFSVMPHLGHCSAEMVEAFLGPERFAAAMSFAVVRNPWDLLFSLYNFTRLRPDHPLHDMVRHMDFDRFLEFELDRRSFTQFGLLSRDGEIIVGDVLRFETLEEDFRRIADRLEMPPALPVLNASQPGDYREHYSAFGRDMVARRFETDIAWFGYDFDIRRENSLLETGTS